MAELIARGVDGFIEINEDFVFLRPKGLVTTALSSHGVDGEKIPISKVAGVGFKSATVMSRGFFQLGVYEDGKEPFFTDSLTAAIGNAQRIVFFSKNQEVEFQRIKNFLVPLAAQNRPGSAPGEGASVPKEKQLLRLQELCDLGILSQAELETEQKKIGL